MSQLFIVMSENGCAIRIWRDKSQWSNGDEKPILLNPYGSNALFACLVVPMFLMETKSLIETFQGKKNR
uniref:Uncharacterized protein n=1 Tax=Arundo donax TaxID=35708 RepID=A0A0A8YAI3_ARUDO